MENAKDDIDVDDEECSDYIADEENDSLVSGAYKKKSQLQSKSSLAYSKKVKSSMEETKASSKGQQIMYTHFKC